MPYSSKGILRHYHYRSDPKLGPGIVAIRRIKCICHDCTAILPLSWYSKTKESFNQPRYGILYNCKYSQIIGCHNNCILMFFLDDGKYGEYYEDINQAVIHGNVMNMSLIITKGKYGALDTDDSSCYGYYIIKFYSSLYTLQADLSIDGKVISSGKIIREGTYFFPISNNYIYYGLQKPSTLTQFSL